MAWHPVQLTAPYRIGLAYIAAVAFLIGGLAVQWRQTARPGLIELATLYFIGELLWVPRLIHYTRIVGVWNGFAEQFAMVAAVLLVFAADRANPGTPTVGMRIARGLFGLCSVSFGVTHFTAIPQTAAMVPVWLPPGQVFWAIVTGITMLLAGLSLISGIMATEAAWLLAFVLLSFELIVWIPRVFAQPQKQLSWGGNAITIGVAASAWMVAEALSRQSALRATSVV